MNPTNGAFEDRVCALEGGVSAVSTSRVAARDHSPYLHHENGDTSSLLPIFTVELTINLKYHCLEWVLVANFLTMMLLDLRQIRLGID